MITIVDVQQYSSVKLQKLLCSIRIDIYHQASSEVASEDRIVYALLVAH